MLRPAAESVFVRLLGDLVADSHSYIAVCIAGVLFFNQLFVRGSSTADGLNLKVRRISQFGIKGYANLIPIANLTFGLIVGPQLSTFQVTKVADVVDRVIRADDSQRILAPGGKLHSARKQDIEHDIVTFIRFTPHAKVFRELIAERAVFMPF